VNARYAAIILAGGLSTRMKRFKPLLPLGETTITDHVIDTFINAGVAVVLVTGFRHDDIVAGIKKRAVTVVHNPDYARGMFSSIQAGLSRLGPETRAFFVLPVDIPLVRPATVRRLLDAAAANPDNVLYPVFGGKRGHPPLVPSGLVPAILGWTQNGGLKAALGSRERLALEVPVADGCILFDIDTPDDYAALLKRFQRYDLPTDAECDAILNDICRVPPDRIRHCLKVAEVAASIGRALQAAGQKIDVEIVPMAARLHDIAKGQRQHDIAGGKIIRELGFGEVGDIVAVHSDLAGGNTHLPLEAKIVYLADKLVKGEKPVSIEERYRHPDFAPEIQKLVLERRNVALRVKQELERLLGRPLESVISPV
jgi:molybdenum cofactor cytidylyltransferase